MKVEIVDVTPELAEEMLTHNFKENRNIRSTYVSQLAYVMKCGRYISENGQTIVFGEDDGVLYDGQHRLNAIVESGTTQRVIVVHIHKGKEAYKTIDNGTKRNASDFISLPNRHNCAAVGKVMACVEWGEAPLLSCLQGRWSTKILVDRGIVLSYCDQHGQEIVDAVRLGGKMKNAVRYGSQTLYAEVISIIRYCGMDTYLSEFIEDFCREAPDSKTVTALKTSILRTGSGAKKLDNKWLVGTLLDAYTHYCEMDGSTMFNKQNLRINQYAKLVQQRRDEAM